ncbi:MAG: argininosuccinate synthase, partial [Faecalibacillus sp.]
DKETQHFKQQVSLKLADILYNGQWYTPLTKALLAFIDETQKTVNGEIKLKLYKGNITNAGMSSPDTLYSEQTASFGEDEDYNQMDSQGFINLYGLPIKVKALLDQQRNK